MSIDSSRVTGAVRRYHFRDAAWFRTPLKALMVGMAAFAALSLYPAFVQGTPDDHRRAIFGLTVLLAFLAMGCIVNVAMTEAHADIGDERLDVLFEGFFTIAVPLADIMDVREITPGPTWRFRWGLSTNFRDRVACSHGGQLVEIELATPIVTRLWPRRIAVRRLWLGVVEADEFAAHLRRVASRLAPIADPRAA